MFEVPDADYDDWADNDYPGPTNKYTTKDSGKMAEYGDGMRRDTTEGKPQFRLMWPKGIPFEEQLITRVAHLYARGAEKYGDRNWEKSSTPESLGHHEEALERHFHKFLEDVQDGEDHAAAVVWNVNAVLLTRRNIANLEQLKADTNTWTKPRPCFGCGLPVCKVGQARCGDCEAASHITPGEKEVKGEFSCTVKEDIGKCGTCEPPSHAWWCGDASLSRPADECTCDVTPEQQLTRKPAPEVFSQVKIWVPGGGSVEVDGNLHVNNDAHGKSVVFPYYAPVEISIGRVYSREETDKMLDHAGPDDHAGPVENKHESPHELGFHTQGCGCPAFAGPIPTDDEVLAAKAVLERRAAAVGAKVTFKDPEYGQKQDGSDEIQPPKPVHHIPLDASGLMPCCGKTPFECDADLLTTRPSLVTCNRTAESMPWDPPSA